MTDITSPQPTEATNTPEVPSVQTSSTLVTPPATPSITIDDFAKIEMKIGRVLTVERIEQSEKLLKLSVDFGEATPRQVLSGIAKYVTPEDLIGKTFPFVTNLPPRKMLGMESQAMILAASDENGLALLTPTKEVNIGTRLG